MGPYREATDSPERTLLVSEISPWETFGGAMRVRSVARALARRGPVDLLLAALPGTSTGEPAAAGFARACVVANDGDIATNRARLPERLPDWIRDTDYDLVWYNRERAWLTAKDLWRGRPTVVDIDDLEDVVLRRWMVIGRNARGGPMSPQDRERVARDIDRWVAVHHEVAAEADVVVFASERDRSRFAFDNAMVVPNTYEAVGGDRPTPRAGGRQVVLFQGYLAWPPNEDAAMWLTEDIFPRIHARRPQTRLTLAGQPSNRIRTMTAHPDITVTGPVPDMTALVRTADVVVAPLRVGGGSRIKILEAFAHRVPVVATPVGAEGLDVVPGVHLHLARSADGLADGCLRLLDDPAAAARMADAAFQLYARRYRHRHAATAVHRVVAGATALRRGRQPDIAS